MNWIQYLPTLIFVMLSMDFSLRCNAEGHEQEQTSSSDPQLARLIHQLADESPEKRASASKALLALGVKAKNLLLKALKSDHAQLRENAKVVYKQIIFNAGAPEVEEWYQDYLFPILGAKEYMDNKDHVPSSTRLGGETRYKIRHNAAGSPSFKGLHWLVSAQEKDGHWDSKKYGTPLNADLAQTSLAVLAVLAGGYTCKIGEFKMFVGRGLDWIRSRLQADGSFRLSGKQKECVTTHALATIALLMGASMSGRHDILEQATRAVKYGRSRFRIEKKGGIYAWKLNADAAEPDLFASMLGALMVKASKSAGLYVEQKVTRGMGRYAQRLRSDGNIFFKFVSNQAPSARATASGIILTRCLGRDSGQRVERIASINSIRDHPKILPLGMGKDPLNNFLLTLAVYEEGDAASLAWHESLEATLLKSQRKDGDAKGSWDPKGKMFGIGRVGTTALNVLALEIYFQYLPLFKKF